MAVASLRLERYAAVAALPACALGSAATADIIYTELNTSIYNDTTSFTMAGATISFSAYNLSYSGFLGLFYLDVIAQGGGFALNGGTSYFGNYPGAQGFAADEEIGAGANFGGSLSWANLAVSYTYAKSDLITGSAAGDWFAGYGGQSRLFLGVEIDAGHAMTTSGQLNGDTAGPAPGIEHGSRRIDAVLVDEAAETVGLPVDRHALGSHGAPPSVVVVAARDVVSLAPATHDGVSP